MATKTSPPRLPISSPARRGRSPTSSRLLSDRRRLERGAAVLHIDLELDRLAAELFDELLAVVAQLGHEFFVGDVLGGLAALALELDEILVDLAEVTVEVAGPAHAGVAR